MADTSRQIESPKPPGSAPRDLSGAPPFRMDVVCNGALLVVAIAEAEAVYQRVGLHQWMSLVHQLQLRLDQALPQARFSMQPGRPGDEGRTVIVAPLQPATTPGAALSLFQAAESLMEATNGCITSPAMAGAALRLQITLHAGSYTSAASAHSGWSYRVFGDVINQALALDGRNTAGCIQVSMQAAALLGPLPPPLCRSKQRMPLRRQESSTFKIRDAPPPKLDGALRVGWCADGGNSDDNNDDDWLCHQRSDDDFESSWSVAASTASIIIRGSLLYFISCAALLLAESSSL